MAAAKEEAGEEIMSVADMLREEGRREAHKEAVQQGMKGLLVKLLRWRFGDLSEAVEARIHAAGPQQIDIWVESLLTARSLDEVLSKG